MEHLEGCKRFPTGWLCMPECEAPGLCPDCGRVVGTFGCKIRHINFNNEWAKGDH